MSLPLVCLLELKIIIAFCVVCKFFLEYNKNSVLLSRMQAQDSKPAWISFLLAILPQIYYKYITCKGNENLKVNTAVFQHESLLGIN